MKSTNTDIVNVSKTNEIKGEDVAQMMGGVVDTIIGLSQKVAENNAARYQAEADVLIESLKCRMETEIQYAKTRERQEITFQKLIDLYSCGFTRIMEQAGNVSDIDESRRKFILQEMDKLKEVIEMMLDKNSKEVLKEQERHTAQIKNRGNFRLLKNND